MPELNHNPPDVFFYKSNPIRISSRDTMQLQFLLKEFGSFENVPRNEMVSACYTNFNGNEFSDTDEYYFFPVHELKYFIEPSLKKSFIKKIFSV